MGEKKKGKERREMNLSKMRKLTQLKRAGTPRKDGGSGTSLKLVRSKKNCVELLQKVRNHRQNLRMLPVELVGPLRSPGVRFHP